MFSDKDPVDALMDAFAATCAVLFCLMIVLGLSIVVAGLWRILTWIMR